jgi:polyisoprenoid-binding protein YceI
MNKLSLFVAATIALFLPVIASGQVSYKVDPGHSGVLFKVQRFGATNFWGRFNQPEGVLVWDEQNPAGSTISVSVQAAKVDTASQKRDDHLRSPDFFNARQFPAITFKSTSISKAETEGQYLVNGDLTLHGVTRPVTVTLVKTGEAETQSGYRAGFETSFQIKRSEHGMNFMQGAIGDDVQIVVTLEAVRA